MPIIAVMAEKRVLLVRAFDCSSQYTGFLMDYQAFRIGLQGSCQERCADVS